MFDQEHTPGFGQAFVKKGRAGEQRLQAATR